MFIDRTKIRVHGGDGGNGVTAFRREKFVPRGGPSGGDGGRGGDVWIVADESVNTLLHLRYNPLHLAKRGLHGEGSNRSGKEGADAIVRVPLGTIKSRLARARLRLRECLQGFSELLPASFRLEDGSNA